jgi:hypothetical protein
MSQILTHASEWPLKPLNKGRQADVDKGISFGNHKGASLQPDLLQKLISKNIYYGYCIPLPLAKVNKILDILIAPMNIQKQNTIEFTWADR